MKSKFATKNAEKLERKTRNIFHKIHLEQLQNRDATKRFRNLITPEILKLPKDYFKDKICADLGCGSAVHGTCNLLDLGAKYVYGMDVGGNFISSAENVLKQKSSYDKRWKLDVGSLMKLPYENEQFDFILCQGVIHHVANDMQALKEIFRVLKNKGKILITGATRGGINTRFYKEFLRGEYQKNKLFATIIDKKISSKWIKKQLEWLAANMENDNSLAYHKCIALLDSLKYLLDDDFVLMLKDRLQAPKYKMYTEKELTKMFKSAGFKSWYRVIRKPRYNNIRKLDVPFIANYKTVFARLLFGEGSLVFVVTK